MVWDKLFGKKQNDWAQNRTIIQSDKDLGLLPNQVLYVEGAYNKKVNKYLSKRSPVMDFSATLLYLPTIAKQLSNSNTLAEVFKYYFPGIGRLDAGHSVDINTALQTEVISRQLFDRLGYSEEIIPGLLRLKETDDEDHFTYEYFKFSDYRPYMLGEQIEYALQPEEIASVSERCIFEEQPMLSACFEVEKERNEDVRYKKESCRIAKSKNVIARCAQSLLEEEDDLLTEEESKEAQLIRQMKLDIEELKKQGFYQLLIKELGSLLLQKDTEQLIKPSRLTISNEFKITLPDFNDLEISMTPLPKALFILFLRHPEGIYLKSLIDYKLELLEIYKLISYREKYLDVVESINRICNPFEGSINEKLSRIKEAFLKQMSMDTAKFYIVSGERGMVKKIELDRELVKLPKAFEEIGGMSG